MDDRISNLLEIIRDEISLYRELMEHARRKTAILKITIDAPVRVIK